MRKLLLTLLLLSQPTFAQSDVYLSCPTEPLANCAISDKSLFKVKSDRRLLYKWVNGPTKMAAFGSPTTNAWAYYVACVYDMTRNTFVPGHKSINVPSGPGTAWRSSSSGFRYRVEGISLKMKSRGGVGRILLKADDADYPTLPFLSDPAVVVQLVNEQGYCWSSYFENPLRNRAGSYVARH